MSQAPDITQLLLQIDEGDPRAAELLLPLVYDELRRLANRKMANERAGQTLDATGLVHEAYLKLVGGKSSPNWAGRRHFFASAAQAMRRILVDRARHKTTVKRGDGRKRIDLDNAAPSTSELPLIELLALDEALDRLAARAPEKAELVKLRYFAGLTTREAADTMGISVATAERHWAFSRSWLYAELYDGDS